MPPRRFVRSAAALSFAVLGLMTAATSEAITFQQVGYTAQSLIALTGSPETIELNGSGTLHVPMGASGILAVSPAGVESPWSGASAHALALSPAGDGYAIGTWPCRCILTIESSGSFSTLQQSDTLEWVSVALGADGRLFATGWVVGGRNGVYQIDRTTGEASIVVEGGPLPGGSTIYGDIAFGADDQLYALGTVYGATNESKLFRLTGSQFTPVATLPHGGIHLARGPGGIFYVTTTFDYGSGYPIGEVWIAEPTTGDCSLLASTGPDQSFWGVAFDGATTRLYVGESARRNVLEFPTIWTVTGDALPARSESWGAVKARYRGR